ncbi:MAG: hypothetical protein GY856_19835, partial [bacterium]|nr:hypothetical protein [bacterium]
REASIERAKAIFRGQGGILRTSQAIALGIHPRTLYAMRDAGELERLSRGLYRLASLPPPGDPDLLTVSLKVPSGVVCCSILPWSAFSTGSTNLRTVQKNAIH